MIQYEASRAHTSRSTRRGKHEELDCLTKKKGLEDVEHGKVNSNDTL